MSKKVLIVEARFYEDMADALAEGAIAVLDGAGISHERVAVPGVLEVPVAIKYAAETNNYDGYVALGVVIRGETTHYEIVCNECSYPYYHGDSKMKKHSELVHGGRTTESKMNVTRVFGDDSMSR